MICIDSQYCHKKLTIYYINVSSTGHGKGQDVRKICKIRNDVKKELEITILINYSKKRVFSVTKN